jgi:hypothetical protein
MKIIKEYKLADSISANKIIVVTEFDDGVVLMVEEEIHDI